MSDYFYSTTRLLYDGLIPLLDPMSIVDVLDAIDLFGALEDEENQ